MKANNRKLGPYQVAMLHFAIKYSGWHGINKDKTTQRVAKSLVKRGLIEINQYNQIRVIGLS